MTDEKELEHELLQLEKLKKIVIDSSTAIRLQEFGLLSKCTQLVQVFVLPSVLEETGNEFFLHANCVFISQEEMNTYDFDVTCRTTDDQIIGFGKKFSYAIVSEDRKVLQKAESLKIPCYTFGILLNVFFLRGTLSIVEVKEIWQQFDAKYSYREDLRQFCQDLLDYLVRSR
jgi:hypothetical protein